MEESQQHGHTLCAKDFALDTLIVFAVPPECSEGESTCDVSAMRTELNGSPGRIRTSDLTVNSRPLYRLSYRGAREQALFW